METGPDPDLPRRTIVTGKSREKKGKKGSPKKTSKNKEPKGGGN